jgi:DNA repair exonuclease SbcCD nuclease subunit
MVSEMRERLLVVGDMHLSNDWFDDAQDALQQVLDIIRVKQIGHVVLLGDIYHRRDVAKGGQEEWLFHSFLHDVLTHSSVHILVGNHDIADSTRILTTEVSNLGHASVAATPQVWHIKEFPFKIIAIPYESHTRGEMRKWFEGVVQGLELVNSKPFMVFGHVPFVEAKLAGGRLAEVSNKYPTIQTLESIPNYKMGIFGDIHIPQDFGDRSKYAGSIRNNSFDVSGPKRVLMMEFEKGMYLGTTSIALNVIDTITMHVPYSQACQYIAKGIYEKDNSMNAIKLKVNCTQDEYKLGIPHFVTASGRAYDLKIEWEINRRKDFQPLTTTDDAHIFETYCDRHVERVSPVIIVKAKEIGREIIKSD